LAENEEVELELQSNQIVVRPTQEVRHRWSAAFKAMAEHDDDEMLDADVMSASEWDETEWEW
jgi:antitoxin component of MazEF toxin-antitoxin module